MNKKRKIGRDIRISIENVGRVERKSSSRDGIRKNLQSKLLVLKNKAKGSDKVEKYLDANKAAYDNLAKRVLSRKIILAHILKETVTEFADCSVEDIEKKHIEGEPNLTINKIPLDDTLYIKGKLTESKSSTEGIVTFDIIFDAIVPKTNEEIKIIVNIEAQKTTKTINYQLMKRAVYYVSRLISAQKEKEFHGDNYNGLKKVYSIWVCMNVQNYRADSIQEYGLTEKVIHGNFHDRQSNYDLIKIIVLNLGKKGTTHRLLNMLHLLFMDKKKKKKSCVKNMR